MIDYADVIYGLAWDDEGKGKISNAIAHEYDYVVFSGNREEVSFNREW